MLSLHIYVCALHVCLVTIQGEKRTKYLLKIELQTIVSCSIDISTLKHQISQRF